MYLKFNIDAYDLYEVEVPYDIVKKQDCTSYKAWAEATSPFLFDQKPCPWNTPITGDAIGNFIVNDIKFTVSRKYLYLEYITGWTQDGNQKELLLAFIYPNLTPMAEEDWSKDNHYEVNLSIKSSADNGCSKLNKGKQCDLALYKYQQQAGITVDKASGAQPQLVRKEPELGMNLYSWIQPNSAIGKAPGDPPRLVMRGEVEPGFDSTYYWTDIDGVASGFYIRGDDPWHPVYWMHCGSAKCEAFMNYADNHIIIRYTFYIDTLLTRHDELRNKIIALLDKWSGRSNSN
jgi:hypothetical protein